MAAKKQKKRKKATKKQVVALKRLLARTLRRVDRAIKKEEAFGEKLRDLIARERP
jgi:hypothetical protein